MVIELEPKPKIKRGGSTLSFLGNCLKTVRFARTGINGFVEPVCFLVPQRGCGLSVTLARVHNQRPFGVTREVFRDGVVVKHTDSPGLFSDGVVRHPLQPPQVLFRESTARGFFT